MTSVTFVQVVGDDRGHKKKPATVTAGLTEIAASRVEGTLAEKNALRSQL